MRMQRGLVLLLFLLLAWAAAFAVPVRVLVTGDMHSWLETQPAAGESLGGAAEMLAYWKHVEGYAPGQFLTLCCGDFNTGPVIGTIFRGDPIVEVMNAMGYDACVLGNHEFDHGVARIPHWAGIAHFPLLVANMTRKDGAPSELGAPYVIKESQGVRVGVIGLMTTDLHNLTGNANDYDILPYAPVLRKYVPEMRARGAQAIIVLAHVPADELIKLAGEVADLQIPLMLGGHSHEFDQRMVGHTWVVNSGEWWRGYSRIDLDYREKTGVTTVLAAKQVWLLQDHPAADAAVAAVIAGWKARLSSEYATVIGYTARGLARPDALFNFVGDCTLAMHPDADVALTNDGGLRQDIPAGPLTKATVIGVMPFTNALSRLTLTGAQLLDYLPKGGFIGLAGLRRVGAQYLVANTGKPIDPTARYTVLMNSFMYDTSPLLQQADPHPQQAAGDWRQPVLDWLAKHPTSKEHPLEELLDAKPRCVAAP